MTSYRAPRATTNPYIVMLDRELAATLGTGYHRFSWKRAFSTRYDVFHTHWTEALMDGSTRLRSLGKQVVVLAAVVWMRLRGVAIVRTVHNVEPPAGLGPIERLVLHLVDRGTRMRIVLNDSTPVPPGAPSRTIAHGHYRDWFAPFDREDPVRGRIGYFGLVRRYKGVETLISSFTGAREVDPSLSLTIAGKPSTDEMADELRAGVSGDAAVTLDLRFLDDAELVAVATASELVVLPYRFMHNSGSLLAALSLDRPVLVPDNETNRLLADEVGREWIYFFDGDLAPNDLLDALAAVRQSSSASPDLTARDWSRAGQDHLAAYADAVR